MIFITMSLFAYGFTQSMTSGLLERSAIEEKYKWDTRDVYENEQAWESDYLWVEENLTQYNITWASYMNPHKYYMTV